MADSEFQAEPPQPPRRSEPPRPRRIDYDDDYDDYDTRGTYHDPVETIIPYKNAKALLSYYFGVFSLICLVGIVLGPAAIVLGILGYSYRQKHPTAKGTAHAIVGIVFGTLGTLLNVAFLVFVVRYAFGIGSWGRW